MWNPEDVGARTMTKEVHLLWFCGFWVTGSFPHFLQCVGIGFRSAGYLCLFSPGCSISRAVCSHEHGPREGSQGTYTDRWIDAGMSLSYLNPPVFNITLSVYSKSLALACNELLRLASIYALNLLTSLLCWQPSSCYYSQCSEGLPPGYSKARSFSSFKSQLTCYHLRGFLFQWK